MASFAGNATPDGAEIGPGLVLGPVRDDCKAVVIGIDFGTAYSGIAFAFKPTPGIVQYGAPTATDPLQTKVPTALLELPNDQWEFGHRAESKYTEILIGTEKGEIPAANLYKRFKMVLKDKLSGMDTLTALSVSGKSIKLMTLITKAIEFLKDYAMSLVTVSYGQNLVADKDVQWVLTVPAIWNEFGKAFMRKAAFKAGLMETEQSDNLMLVLEPEGASLAVHVGAAQHGLLGQGSRFMVLDCGGGTIDITVHDVEKVQPLSLKAVAAPRGGAWGGEAVNQRFKEFLKELLGPDGTEEQSSLLEFHMIYAAFERIKVMYDPNTDPSNIPVVDILSKTGQLVELATAWNEKHPERPINISPLTGRGYLSMSKELMMSFFEPSLIETVNETKKVLAEMPGIRHIMVVGGFGSSKVLTARIKAEFDNKKGVRVIMPDSNPKPQGAIVHGAVYFGLHRDIVSSRVAAYTYGVAVREDGVDEVFSVLVTKGEELPSNHEVTLSGIPVTDEQEALTWRVYRSDKVCPTTVTGEHQLGQGLTADCPKDPIRVNRRQTGKFNFGGSEIRVVIEDARGVIREGEISMV